MKHAVKMRLVAMVALCLVLLVPAVAFAQTAPTAPPTLSVSIAVAMSLSLLLGILTNAYQSGSLFGQITVPKTWLPDLTLAATFLSGVVGYLNGLGSNFALTVAVVFYAVAAGIVSLISGAAPGIARFAHHVAPGAIRAARLAAKGKAVAVATGAFFMLALGACQNGTPTPQTVSDVNAGLTLAGCMFNVYAQDTAANDQPAQIAIDIAVKCGADALQIATVFGKDHPVSVAAASNAAAKSKP